MNLDLSLLSGCAPLGVWLGGGGGFRGSLVNERFIDLLWSSF